MEFSISDMDIEIWEDAEQVHPLPLEELLENVKEIDEVFVDVIESLEKEQAKSHPLH